MWLDSAQHVLHEACVSRFDSLTDWFLAVLATVVYLAVGLGCTMPSPLQQQFVQICPFKVKIFTQLAAGVLEPMCNNGMCIAMTTPFNRQMLEALTLLSLEGEGVVAGLDCHMDTRIFRGLNIRFSVCMDSATAVKPGVAAPDKLQTQTVIYANALVSLVEPAE